MIVIDIEASGTEYKKHSIVSIGALDFDNPEHRFYEECQIWPGAHIMDEALAVCGFTKEQVTDPSKKTEGEIVRMFMEWTQQVADRTLAAQNVSFDRDYLKAACEREGLPWELSRRTIDVHTLCYMHMIKRGLVPPIDPQHRHTALNLDAVMKYCGIPEEPEPHNAMTGTLAHAEVISRLLYGKKLLPEFDAFPIPF